LEQAFDENVHTLRGNAVHKRVDQPGVEVNKGVRVDRGLPLWHEALGLTGKADVVEYSSSGVPYPVEYKHGSRHKAAAIAACDDLQLAAQALCLEEMTGKPVTEGALFYASSKRRRVVVIDGALRDRVRATAEAVRAMLASQQLPPPLRGDEAQLRCKGCSLRERCQPEVASSPGWQAARSHLFDPEA
jgi:CRISPR-associated exonuclease Cas4